MDFSLPIRILLLPLSWVYRVVVQCKAMLYAKGWLRKKRLKGAVISVGNLTVGGTGKTPMVLWLAEKFLGQGKSVAILSRGYRGGQGDSDEVELMRRRLGGRARFGIGASRFDQGSSLEHSAPVDVFVLDDGFQHQQLARDLDLVMLDGSKELKNAWLLPAGPLREPLGACRRADLLVVTRKFKGPPVEACDSHRRQIFYAQTRLLGFRMFGCESVSESLREIGPGPFYAFCGIGNPQAFVEDLERWRLTVAGSRKFRDHHRYSATDVLTIEAAALAAGATGMVTTEKDEQNLRGLNFRKLPVYVAVISFEISAESEFTSTVERLLSERQDRNS
jgi:tetraacyldisaccharide 4'-kinase